MEICSSNNQLSTQFEEERLNKQMKELEIQPYVPQEELDRKELNILLNHVLAYPSTEEAERHRDSNRLGVLDIDREEKEKRFSDNKMKPEQEYNQICGCCGFIYQDKQLQICQHSIIDINNLGISTYVYFRTIVNVAVLLAVMFLVYSIYSVVTNVKASRMEIEGNMSSSALKFLSISLGSKSLYGSDEKKNMYIIGAWIGCGMLVLWGASFVGLKFYQKENEVRILMQTKSVAEYSLLIQKMPTGMTKEDVEAALNKYLKRIKISQDVSIDEIKVEKYVEGKPFYFNQSEFNSVELKQVLSIYQQYKDIFIEWLLQRSQYGKFLKSDKYRHRKYKQYERVIARKEKVCKEIINHIKEEYQKKNKENKTTVFITFQTNHQKNFILDHNPSDMINSIKRYIPFIPNKDRFTIKRKDVTYNLEIYPAPDPQDIVWSNIGVTNCEKRSRKMLTFSITLVILAISFVIVYAMSVVQVKNSDNRYISFFISLFISIINLFIGQVIQMLTKYERDYTMTNYQTSLAIKSILAQLANSIFIPIMANYFIKKNLYEENGLIMDVFILSITNSFVAPLIKLFDPYYLYRIIYAKIQLIPKSKLKMHQFELNQICERMQFQVGYEYIYIVNLFLFTCYFVSLQPIIPIFAICGLGLMYWAQKYSLYNRCQRPVPGTKIINTAMSQMIYFGTIAYTLGSLTWANFLPSSQFKQALLPNVLSLSMAVIIFVLPYETIFRKIFKSKRMPLMKYSQDRIFFTSEYDRLNPSTAEAGIKEYRKFLEKKRKELEQERPQVKSRLSINLELSNRPNFYKKPSGLFFNLQKDSNQAIFNNLLNKQSQNILTPQMIANVIMPEKMQNPRSIMKSKHSPKLKKYQSAIPRKSLLAVADEGDGEQVTEEYWRNLQRIESMDITHGIKQTNIGHNGLTTSNNDQKTNHYFDDISKVRSFVLKPDHKLEDWDKKQKPKSREQPGKCSIEDIQDFLYDNEQSRVNRQRQRQKMREMEQKSRVKTSRNKQFSFRESMIQDIRESINCHAEIANRFSINAENILPLCLRTQEEREDLEESEVQIFDLGCFQ